MNRSLTLKSKQQLVLNSELELGENEGKGKGRFFTSRFLEPGIAHYEELGDILITKETLNKFVHTMVGAPVIIDHEDVTDKNVDKLRVGVISRVWFNEFDGWFYCEGILTDNEAIDLIKNQGWNVSCAYSFESVPKDMHNGKKIDLEFVDGEFLHLAIVKNPRYEGANIVVNKKDDDVEWITVKGNHIPVKKGQSKDEAVKEFLEDKENKSNKKNKISEIDKQRKEFLKEDNNKQTFDNFKNKIDKYLDKLGMFHGEAKTEEIEKILKEEYPQIDINKEKIQQAIDFAREPIKTGQTVEYKTNDKYLSNILLDTIIKTSKDKQSSGNKEEYKREARYQIKTLDREGREKLKQLDRISDVSVDEKGNTRLTFKEKSDSAGELADYLRENKIYFNDILGIEDRNPIKKTKDKQGKKEDLKQSDKDRIKIADLKSRENEVLKQFYEAEEGSSERERLQYELDAIKDERFRLEDKTKKETNNSINKENIVMSVLNDLTDFIKKVVNNEKEDEMKEVKNEDKRKLIDEVGGILKGKVDEELWRTVIGKLEKVAYEPSEDDKADNKKAKNEDDDEAKNKCKNEEDKKEEDKKTDNEDDEEDDKVTKNEDEEDKKEDKEEKTENKKVKNSMKDIVMGGNGQAKKEKLYTSRKERLEEGNKY